MTFYINPPYTNEFSHQVRYNNPRMVHCNIKGSQVRISTIIPLRFEYDSIMLYVAPFFLQ